MLGGVAPTGGARSSVISVARAMSPRFMASRSASCGQGPIQASIDQKPRALLYIGIIVAGLIVPALRRWKPAWLPARYAELYPSDILLPTALGAFLPYTVEAVYHLLTHEKLFARVSEVQELYMYYFVLIYLLDLNKREISKV